jgi:hypothetical protein
MNKSNFREDFKNGKLIFNLLIIFLCSIGIYIFIILNCDSSNYPDMNLIDRIISKHAISDLSVINNITYRSSDNIKMTPSTNAHKIELPSLLTEVPNGDEYPIFHPLYDVIEGWNPDLPDQPSIFKETLQHFNFADPHERSLAEMFRNAEVPFKIYNVPEFDEVVEKWADNNYLNQQITKGIANKQRGLIHIERSNTNHFMFYSQRGKKLAELYKPPTTIVKDMTFPEWYPSTIYLSLLISLSIYYLSISINSTIYLYVCI